MSLVGAEHEKVGYEVGLVIDSTSIPRFDRYTIEVVPPFTDATAAERVRSILRKTIRGTTQKAPASIDEVRLMPHSTVFDLDYLVNDLSDLEKTEKAQNAIIQALSPTGMVGIEFIHDADVQPTNSNEL